MIMVHKINTESSIPLTVDLIDKLIKEMEVANVILSSGVTIKIPPEYNIRILNNEYLQIFAEENQIVGRLKISDIIGVVKDGYY